MQPYNQFICGQDGDALDISAYSTTSNWTQPAEWLYDGLTGSVGKNDSGVAVNGYTALTHCPLWQGVNIIAGDFGQTPVRLLRNKFDEQNKHPAWNLLRVSPNTLQTPSVWKETMMQWALLWGNGVSWIIRQGSRPAELIPLRPDCLWPEMVSFEGEQTMLYHYQSPYRSGLQLTLFPYEVVHFQGLTGDGMWGYPLWQIAKNTIGHGLALERHGNKQFSNGARPSGVLEHPAKLSPEARENLRSDWNKVHSGAQNAGKIAILWEGMKFNPISMSNIDSQWIEAKKMSVYEVASLLNLPPHKLGALQDSSVRANLEEQNADYVLRSLARWYNRADEEYRRKLLTVSEWQSDQFQFKHDSDAFIKGDPDTSTTIADRLVKATILNPNEARDMLGYPPRDGGEVYGSPAINPNENSPSSAGKTPKMPRRIENMSHNAHRELLLDRMLHFIERETISLKQAASGAKNFLKWADEFYASVDGAEPKLFGLCDSVMGSSIRASCAAGLDARGITVALANYAKTRHAQLLEACSSVTQEQLCEVVENLCGDQQALIAQGLLATALARTQETEI